MNSDIFKISIEGKLVDVEIDEMPSGDIFRLVTYRVDSPDSLEEWTHMVQIACGWSKARSIYH